MEHRQDEEPVLAIPSNFNLATRIGEAEVRFHPNVLAIP